MTDTIPDVSADEHETTSRSMHAEPPIQMPTQEMPLSSDALDALHDVHSSLGINGTSVAGQSPSLQVLPQQKSPKDTTSSPRAALAQPITKTDVAATSPREMDLGYLTPISTGAEERAQTDGHLAVPEPDATQPVLTPPTTTGARPDAHRPVSMLPPMTAPSSAPTPALDGGLVDPELMSLAPRPFPQPAPGSRPVRDEVEAARSSAAASVSRSNTLPSKRPPAHVPGARDPSPLRMGGDLARHASVSTRAPTALGRTDSSASAAPAREDRFRWSLGDYMLGKTIGAGSMGKVKYGCHKHTGEKVAVKIIPRHTSVNAVQHQAREKAVRHPRPPSDVEDGELQAALQRAAAKDRSKEVRILREGSLQLLLRHPYICGMREMIVHNNHYYMVFEYINGGQMLDYIISHGRLRERSACGFARQIGSALQYCHANNVVHRDLKIENILISKSGNIKIIDFGLSNLYSPHAQLRTFCGSLYFAAPELLNARVYTGPEVDVWSFGVVLYVLVCGKVPFDDQNMPALHAKIKRGQVDYPVWLSAECKHLLSRMLVTNPQQRASLNEVMTHPWMMKGYEQPEPAHLPMRLPLRPGKLDTSVIQGMTGFEFGDAPEIEARLTEVLHSESYHSALAHWEQQHQPHQPSRFPERRMPAYEDGHNSSESGRNRLSRSLSGIHFYRRRLSLKTREEEEKKGDHQPPGVKGPLDPTLGFHPLISVYFLVLEKMQREHVYGQISFASSDVALDTNVTAAAALGGALSPQGHAPPPSAHPAPTSADIPHEPPKVPELTHASHRTTDLPSPFPVPAPPPRAAAAHTPNSASPELPTPVFESRQKSQPTGMMLGPPRARAHADELETRLRGNLPSPDASSPTWRNKHLPHTPSDTVQALPRRSFSMSAGQSRRATLASPVDRAPVLPSPLALGGTQRAQPTLGTIADESGEAPGRMTPSGPSASVSLAAHTSPADGGSNGHGLSRRFGTLSVRAPTQAWPRASPVPEADASVPAPLSEQPRTPGEGLEAGHDLPLSPEEAMSKPVFLKGLFSVHTTSRRSRQVIRRDLIRVLEEMGIPHREIRGGFECVYHPRAVAEGAGEMRAASDAQAADASVDVGDVGMRSAVLPDAPVATGIGQVGIDRGAEGVADAPRLPVEPSKPPAGGAEGETVFFEVFVVKVPLLLGINGLQFRRVSGNPWQYQTLAKRILHELKL